MKERSTKLKPLQSSTTNIRMGLEMVGKAYLSGRQWIGKFAEQQYKHQYPKEDKKKSKFAQIVTDNFARFKLSHEVCGLCLIEKNKSEMQKLCKCHHQYCYSCLNSYAITKIQDLCTVKCPQQQCNQTIVLTSNVYRYLPDSIKLKYLNNKHTFNVKKQQYAEKCQRCLDAKHPGQCKYALVPQTLQQSFQHRQCPRCKIQIQLTTGKKKVQCPKCKQYLCYLCGVEWKQNQKHICQDKQKIRALQKQLGYQGCSTCCCDCCNYGCQDSCVGCGNCCCRSCGDCYMADCCCEILFNCENINPCSLLWNCLSIPVRILITLLVILMQSMMVMMFAVGIIIWVLICFVVGFFCTTWQIIGNQDCPLAFFLVLFYPITGCIGFAKMLKQTSDLPKDVIGDFCEGGCSMIGDIWLQLSPYRCRC